MKGRMVPNFLIAIVLMFILVLVVITAFNYTGGLLEESFGQSRENTQPDVEQADCSAACYDKYSDSGRIDSCLARCGS